MKHFYKISIILFLITMVIGCDTYFKPKSEEPPVARVKDMYLYQSDVAKAVPRGINARDSISLAKNYINTWIKEKLIIVKAEENLTEDQLNFEEQLDSYRNSLIRYKYETELIRQKLDTVVSDFDIEQYYNQNPNNFQLKHNIIRVNFVGYGNDSAHHEKEFRRLLYADDTNVKDELEEYCKQFAEDYFLEDSWVSFNDFIGYIPLKTYNKEEYLRNNKKITYSDSLTSYMIYFKEFKIRDDISPLGFEKENIRSIIINKRKLELIKQMEQDVFESAFLNNESEIYY